MARAGRTCGQDFRSGWHVVGVEEGDEFADFTCVEFGKERNARHQRPVDDEIAAARLLCEAGRDNRDG